jgi:flagellar hook-associated protein 2
MSIATFSGIASGIQWRDLINQVNQAETAKRLTPVQRESQLEQTRIGQLNRFKGLVDRLSLAARALRDGSAFERFTVTSSDSPASGRALLGATATAGTAPGSYAVEVLALARSHSMASAVHLSDTAALGASGSFTLTKRGADGTDVPVEITVDAADGLNAVRDRINAADAGVSASVVRVGDGSFRLTMVSRASGAEGIRYQDGPGGAGAALGFTLATASSTPDDGFSVPGTDARVRVNGIEVTRPDNVVSDAIAGVRLNLRQAEPGTTVDVSVRRDDAAANAAVKEFVDAYNDVRAFVDFQTSDATQPLARSSVLRSALSEFKNVLLSDLDNTVIPRLGLVGVSLGRDGVLSTNGATLQAALNERLPDVKALLAGVGSRMLAATEMVTRAESGTVAASIRSHNGTIQTLARRADEVKQRLERQYERMEREFIAMERAVSRINAQGNWLTQQVNALQPKR